ncbi:MAG: anaerobic carbon-monoxide dehydrogenase catalytic subunit [bacterium]|nr:anaerobic carbon-monoxide dehydrogenase catalytic subunit [bacterium]
MSQEPKTSKSRTIDKASEKMMDKATSEKVSTAWDRFEAVKVQCSYGVKGICCRHCMLGPCRINPNDESSRGICGADAETMASRGLLRSAAAGCAAHSDHGYDVAHTLLLAAKGELPNYKIKDTKKLMAIAKEYGIDTTGKSVNEIGVLVAETAISEFEKAHGGLRFLKRMPEKRLKLWEKLGIVPEGVNSEIVTSLHRTNMGMGSDYYDTFMNSLRVSIADGWGGAMIATELTDILFGTPKPIRSKVNLGVLSEDMVNVLVHGHEPLLSMMIVEASQDKEIVELAKKAGSKGVNIAGICCTANEILMREGIPVAGNFLQQELAIVTGAVEAMVVDVQCIMPSLPSVAACYHTKIISTSKKAKVRDAIHVQFEETKAYETAKDILKIAIDNFKNRDKNKVNIPSESMDIIAGFSSETLSYMQGGVYRASYNPLVENIKNGKIFGVVGIVGCSNCKVQQDFANVTLAKELIKNNVFVVNTGCAAIASAKAGLMVPEAMELAGPGLREVCEAIGCPPILHAGSCVDNSRILVACTEMIKHGLGTDYDELPIAGAALEWMSEKAITIGNYFVAQGALVVIGVPHMVTGAPKLKKLMYEDIEGITGGKFAVEADPYKACELILNHIAAKRKKLGI